MYKRMVDKISKGFKNLSLSKETGRYLSDKSYGYDTIFFIAKFIERNKIGVHFNKREHRQRAIEYIEDIFNLTEGTAGAVNYYLESLNLLEFADVIKKVDNDNYEIKKQDVLEFICKYPENAYVFIYTLKNDGILDLFKDLYYSESNFEKEFIIGDIYKLFNEKSISIQTENSNWSKQLIKYTNTILGFISNEMYLPRTLKVNNNTIDIFDISLNIEGTRTPTDLKKKNDYINKFSIDYIKYMLCEYTIKKVEYDENNLQPEETIASELAELKLDLIDSKVNPNISNDFEKKQFIEDKMKTRNQTVQREFRKRLFDNNKNICPICGFSFAKFLIASHIKPYALCDNTYDTINQYNGLLLCPNHDKLFESAKFMTIDSSTGEIILNEEAKKSKDYNMLQGKKVDMRLINCERTHYLRWHNQRFREINVQD